jgi:predicted protein tyrosine phosphatase
VDNFIAKYEDTKKPVHNWDIPDCYAYRELELIKIMQERARGYYEN